MIFQIVFVQNLLLLCFVIEYDSDIFCYYKVEFSYENFIIFGLDFYSFFIVDDESDDDDDDDILQVRDSQYLFSILVIRISYEE